MAKTRTDQLKMGAALSKVAATGRMPEIVRDLSSGMKKSAVARKYALPPSAVYSFARRDLASTAYQLKLQNEDGARNAIIEAMASMKKMVDAQVEWMSDPSDPSRFSTEPRADELSVIYEETGEDGSTVRRKASLQELLDRTAGRENTLKVKFTGSDSRLVFLKAMDTYRAMIDTMARTAGVTSDSVGAGITVNIATQRDAAVQIEMVRKKMLLELGGGGKADA